MVIKQTIIWAILALLIGVTIGFGLRAPIASTLGLEAQGVASGITKDTNKCPPGKLWTGNGCADTRDWTVEDWDFYWKCLDRAAINPPPPLPDQDITDAEYASCAQQTEKGHPRGPSS